MSLPPNVSLQLQRFSQAVASLEARVQSHSAASSSIAAAAPPATSQTAANGGAAAANTTATTINVHLQKARQHMELARTVHALAILLFRARGVDVQKDGGALATELGRIEQLQKKVTKAESTEVLRTSRPSTHLDVVAANRFINHALPDLTDEQRRKLREETAAVKAALAGQQAVRGGAAGGRGSAAGKRGAEAVCGDKPGPKRARAGDKGSGKGSAVGVTAKEAALQFLDAVQEETMAAAAKKDADKELSA